MADDYQRGSEGEWNKFNEQQQAVELNRLRRNLWIWQALCLLLLFASLALGFIVKKVHAKAPLQTWLPQELGIEKSE